MKYYDYISGESFTFDEMILLCQESASSDTTTHIFYEEYVDDERSFSPLSLEDISDLSGLPIEGDEDVGYTLTDKG